MYSLQSTSFALVLHIVDFWICLKVHKPREIPKVDLNIYETYMKILNFTGRV